jgi:hypothetical protein
MLTYSIDMDNNVAVHPNQDDAIKEAGATGAAFATEAQLSEATASWPTSRIVEVWNGFAGAPPFAELKEVKKFTDRKTAIVRIWTAARRLGEALEQEQHIVPPAPVVKAAKAVAPAAAAPTAPAQAPLQPKTTKGATSTDGAPAPKQREGTRKATVIALLERAGGATLEEILAATSWQKHSVRSFISTLGSKRGYTVTSIRRETDRARVYAIKK